MQALASREVAVVQFPHPGREWWPDPGTLERRWTDWDHGHARKFLLHRGTLVDREGRVHQGKMTFWGEWEGPSDFRPTDQRGEGMPTWFQIPRRGRLSEVARPQNTDPFVFGAFLYSNCMQDHEWPKGSGLYRPTAMGRLAPGSVILFGSTQAGTFVLDTCFVVAGIVEVDDRRFANQVAGRVPDAFVDATLRPAFIGVNGRALSLYIGAEHAGAEPFSFFPCHPADDHPRPFARPPLEPEGALRPALNPRSSRRFRRYLCDEAEAAAIWSEVRRQVLESAGMCLGIHADPL